MNPVLQTLREHRTYRQFDPAHRIPAEQVQAMLDATRQAPSWMNGQHYTIIRITDPALRQKIAAAQPSPAIHRLAPAANTGSSWLMPGGPCCAARLPVAALRLQAHPRC